MGESQKLKIVPKTLDDILITDGLCAVSTLSEKEGYCVVGGIATQSYIPANYRRLTSDLDLFVLRPLNYEDFKELINPIAEYLQDNGYKVDTRKHSRAYAIEVVNDDGESVIIEFARKNRQNFEKNKERLEREVRNSRKKIIEGKDMTYAVAAPEDIALPKLVRAIGSLRRNRVFKGLVPKELKGLSAEEAQKRLDFIKKLREEAMYSPSDPVLAEKLRFVSDLYDMGALAELGGFNPGYFNEAAQDWEKTREDSEEKRLIVAHVLPNLK